MIIPWWKSKDIKLRLWCFETAWYRSYRVLEARSGYPTGWYRAEQRCKRLRQAVTRRQNVLRGMTRYEWPSSDREAP